MTAIPIAALALGIVAEVVAALALQSLSRGRRASLPIVVGGYAIVFACLAVAVARVEVGIVYSIWAGCSAAAVATCGVLLRGERSSAAKAFGVLAVIAGTVLLQLS